MFRKGKVHRVPPWPGHHCDTHAPLPATRRASSRFEFGYTRSMPVPNTAIVRPPASSAARCETVSIPSARPDTTVTPAFARRPATSAAFARPSSLACRVPTTAMARSSDWRSCPRTNSTGGRFGTSLRFSGYCAMPEVMTSTPLRLSFSIDSAQNRTRFSSIAFKPAVAHSRSSEFGPIRPSGEIIDRSP